MASILASVAAVLSSAVTSVAGWAGPVAPPPPLAAPQAAVHPAAVPRPTVAPAPPGRWQWPLDPPPPVVRAFEPPAGPWGAGHRGIDLPSTVGAAVVAMAAGRVGVAGVVAGRGVVAIDHGQLTSTYLPVTPLVRVGEQVRAGQLIGFAQAVGSHCPPLVCLHVGLKDGTGYLDPLSVLPAPGIRLKPW